MFFRKISKGYTFCISKQKRKKKMQHFVWIKYFLILLMQFKHRQICKKVQQWIAISLVVLFLVIHQNLFLYQISKTFNLRAVYRENFINTIPKKPFSLNKGLKTFKKNCISFSDLPFLIYSRGKPGKGNIFTNG